MADAIHKALVNACRALLRPIALVVMRAGMTWREFNEISKGVFVSVASDEFGMRGRPTNVSRVSILTGISRKEVKRQRTLLAAEQPETSSRSSDATRVLSAWHQDPAYLDADGCPLPLSPSGPVPSFSALFAGYGGDTPEQTLLRELRAAGSVGEDGSGRLLALRRYHMPAAVDEGAIRFFGTNLFDHANTLSNNLAADGRPKRLEGFAVEPEVDARHVEAFREFIDQRGQAFLEEVDAWLAERRIETDDANASPIRLGLGVYAVEGPLPEGTLS
jgi:hypothetical protein